TDYPLAAVDLAVVVTDPDPGKAILLRPLFQEMDRQGVPRLVFVNKIDQAHGNVGELLDALQPASTVPLVARQLPILQDDKVTGMGRLLQAGRHEAPGPEAAAARLGAEGSSAYVFKTTHAGQAGKLALTRVLAGKIADGAELTHPSGEKARASGLFHLMGAT